MLTRLVQPPTVWERGMFARAVKRLQRISGCLRSSVLWVKTSVKPRVPSAWLRPLGALRNVPGVARHAALDSKWTRNRIMMEQLQNSKNTCSSCRFWSVHVPTVLCLCETCFLILTPLSWTACCEWCLEIFSYYMSSVFLPSNLHVEIRGYRTAVDVLLCLNCLVVYCVVVEPAVYTRNTCAYSYDKVPLCSSCLMLHISTTLQYS